MKHILIAAALTALSFAACDRNAPEGPAERAGRKIDNAADEVHDDAVRTSENAKEIGRDIKHRVRTDDDAEDARERANRY